MLIYRTRLISHLVYHNINIFNYFLVKIVSKIPLVQSPLMNFTKLLSLREDWTRGFTVIFIKKDLIVDLNMHLI